MKKLTKVFDKFDKFVSGIAVITLFIMMVWIFMDVMLRNLINSPLQGTNELTGEYLMVLLVYLSISITQKNDGHVRVTFLEDKFPAGMKNVTRFITNIMAASLFLFIAILNFQEGLDYLAQNIKSVGVLSYPLAPALFIISFGLILITIRLVMECISILLYKKILSTIDISESDRETTTHI